jgi:histidine phosphotransferase ChpT
MEETDFAALLCSRLCHDLIGPVSAVSNGIEILEDEDDPEMRNQVFDLIKKSTNQSSALLQFYRAAFGAGGGLGDKVDLNNVKPMIENFLLSKKTSLNWQSSADVVNKSTAKLILNLVLITVDSLVRGGEVKIIVNEGGTKLVVEGVGTPLILYPAIKDKLLSQKKDVVAEARTAPALLIVKLAEELGVKVSLDISLENCVRLMVD